MRSSALFLTAVMALTACSGDDDQSRDSGAAPATAGTVTDATNEVVPVELPASYPTVVPVPAEVELDNAEEHVGTSSTIYELTGWYDGDPIRVARDYEKVLKDLGFEITSRTEAPDNLYFVAQNDDWYVSAGFFPDPIRNVGASVGVTVAPAG